VLSARWERRKARQAWADRTAVELPTTRLAAFIALPPVQAHCRPLPSLGRLLLDDRASLRIVKFVWVCVMPPSTSLSDNITDRPFFRSAAP